MDEQRTRKAATSRRPPGRTRSTLIEHPDRIALWAVALAVIAMIAGAATSHAAAGSAGGVGSDGGGVGADDAVGADDTVAPGCADAEFGDRTLRVGDCGSDVEILSWILRSQYRATPLTQTFDQPTATAVAALQASVGLSPDGVVDDPTAATLVSRMTRSRATWYGRGIYGSGLACGGRLRPSTIGVAHKTLPCGSKVVIRYRGRFVRTEVVDRGPYGPGIGWDLTTAAARRVGLLEDGIGNVRVAIAARGDG